MTFSQHLPEENRLSQSAALLHPTHHQRQQLQHNLGASDSCKDIKSTQYVSCRLTYGNIIVLSWPNRWQYK